MKLVLLNYMYSFLLGIVGFVVKYCAADGIVYRSPSCCRRQNPVPDIYKKTPDFIEANGYTAEIHSVTTEDGYIVTLHRIPGKQSDKLDNEVIEPSRPAILIQHGLGSRSDNWLLNGPTSFPFVLADSGYDVWLADTRGNYYSKRHVRMKPSEPKYWDFSFHEQGYYDMPAMTDYILRTTGHNKIFYVGHSRGTTMSYVLLSQRPEFNNKFHLIIQFAPVTYLSYTRSPPLRAFLKASSLLVNKLPKHLRLLSMPGANDNVINLRKSLCRKDSITQKFLLKLLFSLAGYDYELFNVTRSPVISTHFPDGGSLKEYLHFIQVAISNKFRPYDYGHKTNLKKYGTLDPPEYNLENITVPMLLIYGKNDLVCSRKDLTHLKCRLRNNPTIHEVPYEKFNHIDFLWGTKADSLVYRPTIEYMNKFSKLNLPTQSSTLCKCKPVATKQDNQ